MSRMHGADPAAIASGLSPRRGAGDVGGSLTHSPQRRRVARGMSLEVEGREAGGVLKVRCPFCSRTHSTRFVQDSIGRTATRANTRSRWVWEFFDVIRLPL